MAKLNHIFIFLATVLLCYSAKGNAETVENEQEIEVNSEQVELNSKKSTTLNVPENKSAIMIFPGAFFFFSPATITTEAFSTLQPQISFSPVFSGSLSSENNGFDVSAPFQAQSAPAEAQSLSEKTVESLFVTGYIPPSPILATPSLRGYILKPVAASAAESTAYTMQPNTPAKVYHEKQIDEKQLPLQDSTETSFKTWDYRHQGADWSMPACGNASSQRQSPINIFSNNASIGSKEQTISLDFAVPSSFYIVTDNGHSLQLEAPMDTRTTSPLSRGFGSVFVNQKEYKVVQFHFHAPAEHTFSTETARRALELHIVTKFNDSDLLVVGVTFQPSSMESSENSFLDAILSHPSFSLSPSYIVDALTYPKPLQLSSLFSSKGNIFFAYAGSLTTPPCSEIVTWYVLEKPIVASEAQLRIFTDLFAYPETKGNYRVVQNTPERSHNSQPLYVVRGYLA